MRFPGWEVLFPGKVVNSGFIPEVVYPWFQAISGLFLRGFNTFRLFSVIHCSAQTPDLSRLNPSLISVILTHPGVLKGVF